VRRLVVLALLGCASAGGNSTPAPEPPDRILVVDDRGTVYRTLNERNDGSQQSLPVTRQQAYIALVAAYGDLGLEVNTLDSKVGRVGARNVNAPRRLAGQQLAKYLDCGSDRVGAPAANSFAVLLNAESVVAAEANGSSEVRTVVSASAQEHGTSASRIPCTSTGQLERRINLTAVTHVVR
jgi:hypothetical protein